MTPADLVLHARWVIPVEPDGAILENHALVVRDGRIQALLPSDAARGQFQASASVELPHHVLIPGLVNAYACAATSLLRGFADDAPLLPGQDLGRNEIRWATAEFVRDGGELAMAGMLRSGTTCFNDTSMFPDAIAEAAQHCGLRTCLGMIVSDTASAWAGTPQEYLAKGIALRDRYKDDPLLSFAFALRGVSALAEPGMKAISVLADELDVPVHACLHASRTEIERSLQQSGQRPLARLAASGWLSPNFISVHMTQLLDDEITLLARAGVHVVHCPRSGLRSARGFCPVAKLLAAGVNVALGTDGTAGGNGVDLLAEMQCAALLAKAVADDAAALPAATALHMATLNGARALGLERDIGSLLPGKWADVTAIDMHVLECQPLYNPLSQLVYHAGRQQVSDVWVAGRQLLRSGRLTTLDADAILASAARWQHRIGADTHGAVSA